MIEDDVKRVERKVDLFFKVVLGLKMHIAGHDHNLYSRKYIDKHIADLIPVYDLSSEKDTIENYPTQETIQTWERKLNTELVRLKTDYKQGNFLAKEKDEIKTNIKNLGNKLDRLLELSNNKLKFESKSIEIHKINLFRDLEKKLGITKEYDSYGFRKLIREKDTLKTSIRDLIEDLSSFFKK